MSLMSNAISYLIITSQAFQTNPIIIDIFLIIKIPIY